MPDRDAEIRAFLAQAGWGDAAYSPLAGDASYRRYARLVGSKGRAILMDAPVGGDQIAANPAAAEYNQTAHLAVECAPFVAIGAYLCGRGYSAPEVFAHDLPLGLLLLEDFGDALFFDLLADGAEAAPLYEAAIDLLLDLHHQPPPAELKVVGDETFALPEYDAGALAAEVALLLDWYLSGTAQEPDEAVRTAYLALWQELFPVLAAGPRVLVLRDFHAQNLFWLPQRDGVRRVGLIDFQDGLRGSSAYDLVSLLQDARRDVPPALESAMIARYCAGAALVDADFDAPVFRAAYAVAGAQRNSRLLGTFTRLARRDGKRLYLDFIPRVRGYLERSLADPLLAGMRAWTDANLPPV